MELVFYRNRSRIVSAGTGTSAEEAGFGGHYDYSAADQWAENADDFIQTVSAIARETLSGLQRLTGYIWQRTVGCVRVYRLRSFFACVLCD